MGVEKTRKKEEEEEDTFYKNAQNMRNESNLDRRNIFRGVFVAPLCVGQKAAKNDAVRDGGDDDFPGHLSA